MAKSGKGKNPVANEAVPTEDDDELSGGNGNDTLHGGTGDDKLYGDNGSDTLYGDEGEDELHGGNAKDTLFGGADDDKLHGDNGNDELHGDDGDDKLYGGNGVDTLYGGQGNDLLDGGSGGDLMAGGAGDDTYVVDSRPDKITELAYEGEDTIKTSLATFTLANNLENLEYTGSRNFTGTGNELDNEIEGGSGKDKLYGLDGDDELYGKGGNDLLYGGNGDDRLDGGNGADAMSGGSGDDTYIVDDAGDTVNELADAGLDTVQTSLSSYTLGDHVEDLAFTGAGNFSGTGNALANSITGGAGDDTLNGGMGNDILDGGLGLDIINGGDGMDTILLHALGGVDADIINDFVVVDDQFALSQVEFGDILDGDMNGVLDAGLFEVGAAATSSTTRIVYDDTTGAVMYDADGNGAGAAVTIAHVSTGLLISSDDFNVI